MAGEIVAEVIDYFYSENRPKPGNLRWRVTPAWWTSFVDDLKRSHPVVDLDPVTRKVPDMIMGIPVVQDPTATRPFVLEKAPPITPADLRFCLDASDVRPELAALADALREIDGAMMYGIPLREMTKTELMACCVVLVSGKQIPRYRTEPIRAL